jgi:hypothetical protein
MAPKDSWSPANAVIKLADGPSGRAAMGRKARAFAEANFERDSVMGVRTKRGRGIWYGERRDWLAGNDDQHQPPSNSCKFSLKRPSLMPYVYLIQFVAPKMRSNRSGKSVTMSFREVGHNYV